MSTTAEHLRTMTGEFFTEWGLGDHEIDRGSRGDQSVGSESQIGSLQRNVTGLRVQERVTSPSLPGTAEQGRVLDWQTSVVVPRTIIQTKPL